MNVKIAYLYYDLMNLYGERGNVDALLKSSEYQSISVELSKLTLGDEINFENYDIFVIGCGTENNQKIVLEDLSKYKEQIKLAIENGKFFLCTGNSIELFGKKIISDKEYEGLGVFDYTAKYEEERLVSESLFDTSYIGSYVLGFQNQGGSIKDYEFNLFDVEKGIGSYKDSKKEGIHYNNFFGTYLLGPILIRNPEFLEKFVIDVILEKNSNYRYRDFDFELEKEAYNNFIKLYHPEYYKK